MHHHLLANDGAHFFLPIFTAAKDEKYFRRCQQAFDKKSLLTSPSNVLPYYLKKNFPVNNLNHSMEAKVMGSNPGYLLKSILLYDKHLILVLSILSSIKVIYS